MPKAHSPIRIQEELMRAATAAGQQMHRSATEQLEYWATIGQSVSGIVDPDKLLDVLSGLSTIEVRPVENVTVDVDSVLQSLEKNRSSGALKRMVKDKGEVHYQACAGRPGFLERISEDGTVTVGTFENGSFRPE